MLLLPGPNGGGTDSGQPFKETLHCSGLINTPVHSTFRYVLVLGLGETTDPYG